jgi:hypothetical protein
MASGATLLGMLSRSNPPTKGGHHMVAKKKTERVPLAITVKEAPAQGPWPEVQSLSPAIIDLFARVIMNVNQEDVEAYAEIVKEHQEALLRALNRNAWSGSHS